MSTQTYVQPAPATTPKSWTRHLVTTARILTGLAFLLFGLNGFLNFLPQPSAPMPEKVMAFVSALMNSGYMFPLIFGTQLIVAILLLINRFIPLALVLIAPFLVNSIAFHLFLEHSGLPMAAIFVALEIGLVYAYRHSYRSLFAFRATPGIPLKQS